MSFIGNIFGGYGAGQLGDYNSSVTMQQSKIEALKADVRKKIYNTIERPKLIRDLDTAYSQFKSSVFMSGVELRAGETTGLVALRNKQNIINEIAMADYNSTIAVNDLRNQSILLQAKSAGEKYKGEMTKRTEYAKAVGSLLTMGSQSKQAGELVIS